MKRKSKAGSLSAKSRADRLLRQTFPGLSGRQIEEALDQLLVVDLKGKRIKKGDYIEGSEQLDSRKLQAHLAKLALGNPDLNVSIVDERSDYLVVDKPSGMASHPISLFDFGTVTQWALAHYPTIREQFSEVQPTVTPHRLDTGTSGLLIVARTQEAFHWWRQCFQKKQVKKKYLAWCWGSPNQTSYRVDWPIGHDPRDHRKMVSVTNPAVLYARPLLEAHTSVTVLKQNPGWFLVEVSCETGVTHQVRVHLASLGFPLVGDTLYDPSAAGRLEQASCHLLRACSIIAPGRNFQVDTTAFEVGPLFKNL